MFHRKVGAAKVEEEEVEGNLVLVLNVVKKVIGQRTVEDVKNKVVLQGSTWIAGMLCADVAMSIAVPLHVAV